MYNYHETTRGFVAVGQMANGYFNFTCDGSPCASVVFSDGSSRVPVVRVRVMSEIRACVSHSVYNGNEVLSLANKCFFD